MLCDKFTHFCHAKCQIMGRKFLNKHFAEFVKEVLNNC